MSRAAASGDAAARRTSAGSHLHRSVSAGVAGPERGGDAGSFHTGAGPVRGGAEWRGRASGAGRGWAPALTAPPSQAAARTEPLGAPLFFPPPGPGGAVPSTATTLHADSSSLSAAASWPVPGQTLDVVQAASEQRGCVREAESGGGSGTSGGGSAGSVGHGYTLASSSDSPPGRNRIGTHSHIHQLHDGERSFNVQSAASAQRPGSGSSGERQALILPPLSRKPGGVASLPSATPLWAPPLPTEGNGDGAGWATPGSPGQPDSKTRGRVCGPPAAATWCNSRSAQSLDPAAPTAPGPGADAVGAEAGAPPDSGDRTAPRAAWAGEGRPRSRAAPCSRCCIV